ncbi:hypothetical protein [Endozoicomonas euniceicola]|uniref:Uncharacterized protein n=1 Tax=Endozoicomonas euniceicola TaxID=1234143 RepID=A0ABY6GWG0_9GAMM|nr:hypothetical protein [Endozoicomonas euniceicola]UYM17110.1 hypothetical protein NX720_04080 [Endozoicomonas euniceicola]
MYYRHLISILLSCLMLSSPVIADPKKGYLILNIQNFDWPAFFKKGKLSLTSNEREGSLPLRRISALPRRISRDQIPYSRGLYNNIETIHQIGVEYSRRTGQDSVLFEFDLPDNLYQLGRDGPYPDVSAINFQTRGESDQNQNRRVNFSLLTSCFRSSRLNTNDSESGRPLMGHLMSRSGYDNYWNSEHYSGFTAETGRVIPVELTSSEEEQNSHVYYSLILPHHEQVDLPPPRPAGMERMRTLLGKFFAIFMLASTQSKRHR